MNTPRLKTGLLLIVLTAIVLLVQPLTSIRAHAATGDSPGATDSIVLEGENASSQNWSPGVQDNPQMSGGKYLLLYTDQLDATGVATATYTFTAATAGLYNFVIWSTPTNVGWASPYQVKLNGSLYPTTGLKQYATHPVGSLQKLESVLPVQVQQGTNTVSILVNQRRGLDHKYVVYLDLLMFTPWIDWMKVRTQQYQASGDISAGLASQLTTDLTQAQSLVDAGNIPDAKHALGQFLQHLNAPPATQHVSQAATDELSQMADTFLLQVSPERRDFQAYASKIPSAPQRYLYVIDTLDRSGGEDLFTTLLSNEGKQVVGSSTAIVYVYQWAKIQTMATQLNLKLNGVPALVMTDDRLTIQGALTDFSSSGQILQFLSNPKSYGHIPTYPQVHYDSSQPVQNGMLAGWLKAGTWSGQAGTSGLGLDSEQELRPDPGEPFSRLVFLTTFYDTWRQINASQDGGYNLEDQMPFSASWGYGTAYAFAYVYAPHPMSVTLHVRQSGVQTAGWLDGQPMQLKGDNAPPTNFPAFPANAEAAQASVLRLDGWHRWHQILLKFVTQQDQGQRFYFAAQFTNRNGKPVDQGDGLQSQTWDPHANLALNQEATRLLPLTYVEAPANLPHPTDPIKLTVDLRWFQTRYANHPTLDQVVPFIPFQARVRVEITDFNGRSVAAKTVDALLPNASVTFDFGIKLPPGYYATHLSLYNPRNNRLIATYYADGFSVIAGASAQRERVAQKKIWDNYYYVSPSNWDLISTWLERMGIYKIVGSDPNYHLLVDPSKPILEDAQRRGLTLMGDFGADSPTVNTTQAGAQQYVSILSKYTCFFKSINELDIKSGSQWVPVRTPAKWIQRQQWEYQLVHQACPDGVYIGPSLARPGAEADWFAQLLQLGMDKYLDAWDVHAYPQHPPLLEGTIGNNDNEADTGVLKVFQQLGRTNTKPFWLGETGALPWHGFDGLRWQADTTAKMVAWALSRSDYRAIAFLIAHDYTRSFPNGEYAYASGHRPGEAALYTASALIDGFSYKKVASGGGIEAAWFGNTFMLWSTAASKNMTVQLDRSGPWVAVDVIGRVRPLHVGADGKVTIQATQSPVYILKMADYQKLTRM